MKDALVLLLGIACILAALSIPPLLILWSWNLVAVPVFTVKAITFWQAALAYLGLGVVGACFKSATK